MNTHMKFKTQIKPEKEKESMMKYFHPEEKKLFIKINVSCVSVLIIQALRLAGLVGDLSMIPVILLTGYSLRCLYLFVNYPQKGKSNDEHVETEK